MAITNKWVGYLDRTATQISDSVKSRLATFAPEITDLSESNPFIKIIGIWGGIAETLHYYLDNVGREAHLASCRLFRSGVKHAKANDYRVHTAYNATGEVTFTLVAHSSTITVDSACYITREDGTRYYVVGSHTIAIGATTKTVPVRQVLPIASTNLGTSDGSADQVILIPTNLGTLAEGTFSIAVDGVDWTAVDTFGFSSPTSQHYMISVNETGRIYVKFGDGIQGAIPETGLSIDTSTGLCSTSGAEGNSPIATLTTINGITFPTTTTVSNLLPITGGTGIETLEQLRKRIPLSIRTLRRAVTPQDFKDIAEQFTGVSKSSVGFACGKKVSVYVVPVGGGVASSTLLNDVRDYFAGKKIITTKIETKAVGEIGVQYVIDAEIVPNYTNTVVATAIKNSLIAMHANQDIKGSVQLSDVYEAVETTTGVLFSKVSSMKAVPYGAIIFGSSALVWTREIQTACNTTIRYRIVMISTSQFQVSRGSTYLGTYNLDAEVVLTEIVFTIEDVGYTLGDAWEFYVYPSFGTLNLVENSIAVTDASLITVNATGGL